MICWKCAQSDIQNGNNVTFIYAFKGQINKRIQFEYAYQIRLFLASREIPNLTNMENA